MSQQIYFWREFEFIVQQKFEKKLKTIWHVKKSISSNLFVATWLDDIKNYNPDYELPNHKDIYQIRNQSRGGGSLNIL